MSSKAQPPNVVENRLYVVLHGLVCLIEDPAGFTGYLIDEGNVHVYIAGDFRQEKPISPKEVLTLQNVTPGTKGLDPARNAVVAKTTPRNGSEQSSIVLPRPDDILHFVCGLLIGGSLSDPDGELKSQPVVISGTRVFQYSFTDFRTVQLLAKDGSVFWQCSAPTTVGNLAVAILEVYNEPPTDLGAGADQHNLQEFKDSLTFMQAKKVELLTTAVNPVDCDQLPPGLTADQVCSLDVRNFVAPQLKKKLEGETDEISFAIRFGKKKGGGGGTQVCGGANGILG